MYQTLPTSSSMDYGSIAYTRSASQGTLIGWQFNVASLGDTPDWMKRSKLNQLSSHEAHKSRQDEMTGLLHIGERLG